MKISNILFFLFGALVLLNASCKSDGDGDTPAEKVQLDKLKKTWTVESVTLDGDPRDDFEGVTLTFSGDYQEKGTYNYAISGILPNPSPWPKVNNGKWKFGSNVTTDLIRLDSELGSGDEDLAMSYSINDNNLMINFNYTGEGFIGGRVAGNWEFVFK